MPTGTNVTIKKNDGTTDITYTFLEGKSGDNPARWRAPALGSTPQTSPEVRASSKRTNGSRGKVVITAIYPYHVVNSTTGVTSVENRELWRLEYNGSEDIPQATRDEAVSQGMNFLASAHCKSMLKELSAST